jgi:hypothetical protein
MHNQSMTQYIYVSVAIKEYTPDELTQMLVDFRNNNERDFISGLLIYCRNSFFQLFEGPEEATKRLWENIKQDERHHSVELVTTRKIDDRMFFNWTMAFQNISNEEAATIYGFNELLKAHEDRKLNELLQSTQALSNDVIKMIEDFSERL